MPNHVELGRIDVICSLHVVDWHAAGLCLTNREPILQGSNHPHRTDPDRTDPDPRAASC